MTPTQRRVRLTASIGLQAGLSALIAVGCYGSVGDDAYSGPTGPWAEYTIEPPSDELAEHLGQSPYLYPDLVCSPVQASDELPSSANTMLDDDGGESICVWQSVVATVPEGIAYTELASCEKPFTQAPSWFIPPTQVHVSEPALLDDPDFTAELDWVQRQVRSSACACCHASSVGSGNTSGFDVDAPEVWTDTIDTYRLGMLSGVLDDHRLFGALPASENHGFDREDTMFPSTDPERMRAFFVNEFERRGGTDEDLERGQKAFESFFGKRFVDSEDCVSPWEGIEDGKLIWNGDRTARQVYVQEIGSDIPGFPPSMDQPEGTVWALYVSPDGSPVESGALSIGDVPDGAYQAVPADGSAPAFEEGKSYRVYATPDFMLNRMISCNFTYTAPGVQ